MEWDQYIFHKLYKLYQNTKKRIGSNFDSKYVKLDLKKDQFYIQKFLYLVTGDFVELHFSDQEILWKENKFFIPIELPLFSSPEENKRHLFFWLLFIGLSKKKKWEKPSFLQVFKAILKHFTALKNEYLEWKKSILQLKKIDKKQYDFIFSLFNNISFIPTENDSLFKLDQSKDLQSETQKRKEAKITKNFSNPELLEENQAKAEEYTLGHNFEKIETLEEFDGQWRDLDGEDEMEEQEEALSELKLKHLIRTDNPAHSTVTAENSTGFSGEVNDLSIQIVTARYPEWDYKTRSYRENYCTIQEELFLNEKVGFTDQILFTHKKQLEKLKRKLNSLLTEKTIQRKLKSGDDIDLDAVVERYSDLAAKVTPNELIYTRKKNMYSELHIHFLLDSSLSTDSWLDGKRILDVEKETLVIFCEALEILNIPFSMSAFSSRTRNHCKYFTIKTPYDKWMTSANRLGALEPNGYTRIGPALRHTSSIMQNISSAKKWVILLTDAKPNDYDKYEGKYGIEDVHKAIQEMKRERILLHTLAIGKEEHPLIPDMMREASYQLLTHPSKLLLSLEKFFQRVV